MRSELHIVENHLKSAKDGYAHWLTAEAGKAQKVRKILAQKNNHKTTVRRIKKLFMESPEASSSVTEPRSAGGTDAKSSEDTNE